MKVTPREVRRLIRASVISKAITGQEKLFQIQNKIARRFGGKYIFNRKSRNAINRSIKGTENEATIQELHAMMIKPNTRRNRRAAQRMSQYIKSAREYYSNLYSKFEENQKEACEGCHECSCETGHNCSGGCSGCSCTHSE